MRLYSRLILSAIFFVFIGCGQQAEEAQAPGEAPAAAESKGTIGLSVLTLTNPFFKDIANAMEAEAAEHGYEVIVTSGEFDTAKQQNQIKDFIVKGVDAIVLCPTDSKAIAPAIKEANTAGIPVFTADIAAIGEDIDVIAHVATDNYSGGRQAADAMIEALGGTGQVAILDHPEVESVILRTKGFEERLAEANTSEDVNIEIVAKLPGGGAREKSYKAAEDLLQSHSNLDGIFAINDPSALGAVAALEKAGKADAVKVIGFDGMPEGKKAILEGKIYADPIQFPDRIGRDTVGTIMDYFQGKKVPGEILIPTELYRLEDAQREFGEGA